MKKNKYISGELINGLKFIKEVDPYIKPTGRKERKGLFLCECGTEFEAVITKIKGGYTQSCGCYNKKRIIETQTSHGLTNHPLFGVWTDMKTRCYNRNCKDYKNYGGRGIKICKEWLDDFKSFYNWAIKSGHKKGFEIDRRINNGDYEPLNCRFVTSAVNNQNRRNNKVTMQIANHIRDMNMSNVSRKDIRELYQVSKTTVYNILNNNTWAV